MAISDDIDGDAETVVSVSSSLFTDFPDIEARSSRREIMSDDGSESKSSVPHILYYFQDNMVEISVSISVT